MLQDVGLLLSNFIAHKIQWWANDQTTTNKEIWKEIIVIPMGKKRKTKKRKTKFLSRGIIFLDSIRNRKKTWNKQHKFLLLGRDFWTIETRRFKNYWLKRNSITHFDVLQNGLNRKCHEFQTNRVWQSLPSNLSFQWSFHQRKVMIIFTVQVVENEK